MSNTLANSTISNPLAFGKMPIAEVTPETNLDVLLSSRASEATVLGIKFGTDRIESLGVGRGSFTDRSGSISSGGIAQLAAPANSVRRYFLFQNISIETLWINFGATAVADIPSIRVLASTNFILDGHFVSTEVVSVIGATMGSKFILKEG